MIGLGIVILPPFKICFLNVRLITTTLMILGGLWTKGSIRWLGLIILLIVIDYYKILSDVVAESDSYFRGATNLSYVERDGFFVLEILFDGKVLFCEKTEVEGKVEAVRNMLCLFMLGRIFRYAVLSATDDLSK